MESTFGRTERAFGPEPIDCDSAFRIGTRDQDESEQGKDDQDKERHQQYGPFVIPGLRNFGGVHNIILLIKIPKSYVGRECEYLSTFRWNGLLYRYRHNNSPSGRSIRDRAIRRNDARR